MRTGRPCRFGEFSFDPLRARLSRAEEPIDLPHKAVELLDLLVANRGRVVEKAEIFDALWPEVAVQESNLTQTVYVLRKALGDASGNAEFVRTVPRRGYVFVAAVTDEVSAAAPAPDGAPAPPVRERAARGRWTLFASALASLAVIATWTMRPPTTAIRALAAVAPDLQPLTEPRRSVAVLPLQNELARPGDAWLATALAETLSAELARNPRLRPQGADAPVGSARPAADLVVSGAYRVEGQGAHRTVRVDLHIREAGSASNLASASQEGSLDDIQDLAERLGRRLGETVTAGSARLTREEAGLPEGSEAMRAYAEGLDRLRAFDAVAARDRLEQAVALAPRSPLAHFALSLAWRALGHDVRARESGQQADRLAGAMAPERRLAIQAHLFATSNEWARAAEIGATLTRLFPDEIEHVLRRAEAETRAGRPRDAIEGLVAARGRPGLDANDPRLALAEVQAQGALGDNDAEGRAAERMRRLAADRGERHLEARALSALAWFLRNAARPAEAEAAARKAGAVFAATGDRNAEAITINIVAVTRNDLGRFDEALALWEDCLRMRRATGHVRGVATVQNNMAAVLTGQGRLDEARATYAEVIRVAAEIADRRMEAVARYNLARILLGEGQIDDARGLLEQARALARQAADRGNETMILLELTRTAYAQARLTDAEALLGEAERGSAALGTPLVARAAAATRFDLLMARGDRMGARRVAEDLRRQHEAAGNPNGVMEADLALASVLVEEDRHAEAEVLARRTFLHWKREGNAPMAAVAGRFLSRALWSLGRRAEARRLFGETASEAWQSGQRCAYAELRAERARYEALDGDAAAVATLREILEEAERHGWERLALELRLGLGEVEMRNEPAGRTRLASLVEDARQKGFEAVAARAQDLLARPQVARAGR